MNRILPAIALMLLLASCSSTKNYLAHRNEDKTLYSIIKQLNKKPGDELAMAALPDVYAQLQLTHLANIENHTISGSAKRWDRIAGEYVILQDMYNAIINSSTANNLVKAVSYQDQIDSTRLLAAEDYYQSAIGYFSNGGWEGYRKAYADFKKADGWIDNYNNSELMMDSARKNGVVTVVINPVQDNSFIYNTGWSYNSYHVNSSNMPQSLTNDLGGRYPAKFYTEWDAQKDNANVDWLVNLSLSNVYIPSPDIYNYSRERSTKVEDGKDSTGNTLYKTVYATVHIRRQSFNARASMNMNITSAVDKKNIASDSFTDTYDWQQEVASYSGDSRALNGQDWDLMNNRYNQPDKGEVMSELYRGLYPQVKSKLARAVDW